MITSLKQINKIKRETTKYFYESNPRTIEIHQKIERKEIKSEEEGVKS